MASSEHSGVLGTSKSEARVEGFDLPRRMARRLAVSLPLERLHPHVVNELQRIGSIDEPLAVACSGGADSLCALLLIWAHFFDLREHIVVLHFDHRIRGEESAADARFVQEIADLLKVKCIQGRWEGSSPDASEEDAREARMAFLHEHAKVICFGHNQTDVAETILMRLGRGSSLDGLAGPRPVQRFKKSPWQIHLRPLLNISGAEIRESLRACGIPWREDSTNAGTKYTRNKLRNEVLPMLEDALGRDWAAGAARSRARIDEADRYIDCVASRFLSDRAKGLDLGPMRGQRAAVIRRAVELWLAANDLRQSVPPEVISFLVTHVQNHFCDVKTYRSIGIEVKNDVLLPTCPEPSPSYWNEICACAGSVVCLPGHATLEIEAIEFAEGDVDKVVEELRKSRENDSAILALPHDSVFTIRRRFAGDGYHPMGAPGRKSLQDLHVNRKIPQRERALLPVVIDGDRVVWSPFLPPAEECKLTSDCRKAVRLTYRNISPASDSYK